MDVDEANDREDFLHLFDQTPGRFAWRDPTPDLIESRRAQMSDLLIFDILLSLGGIKQPDALYPPFDVRSLGRLLDAIRESKYDALKRDCLVYFLLKWHQDGREESFQEDQCLPPQFVALADAYWHLDSGINVEKAVAILSDSRLNRDYSSKIIQAISLTENASPLIIRYVRTAKPILTEPDDIQAYALALAESSLLEAWQFQRTFSEGSETRTRLVRKILDWCLSPKPRSQPLSQLLAFPFSTFEQSLIRSYALQPPPTCPPESISILQELLCVRLVQSGQFADAIKLDRQFSASTSSSTKAQSAMHSRRKIMDDIMAALSTVEGELLEFELEEVVQANGMLPATSRSLPQTGSGLGDLTMSWEEIRPVVNSSSASVREPLPILPISSMPHSNGTGSALSRSITNRNAPQLGVAPSATNPISQPSAQLVLGAAGTKPSHIGKAPPRRSLGTAGTPSLFDSVGSAKHVRNAFYNPPAASTASPKRPFVDDQIHVVLNATSSAPRTHKSAEEQDHSVEDIAMDSDDDFVLSRRTRDDSAEVADAAPEELSFSVFSPSGQGEAGVSWRDSRQSATKADAAPKAPPGAFLEEFEEEQPYEEIVKTRRQPAPRRVSPSPPPRSSRTARPTRAQDLGRSLPGSLMDQEEEEEEVDELAPLPASPQKKAPTRKGRGSRSSEEQEQVRPRRSSRLSTASVASSSPEPPSPQEKKGTSRTRKGARASALAPSKTDSKTRKKR